MHKQCLFILIAGPVPKNNILACHKGKCED